METRKNLAQAVTDIAASGKPYLGDPVVVETQVRSFVAGIVKRWGQYVANTMDRETATGANGDAAKALAKVMSGQDAGYMPIDGWTGAADGQGAFIAKALGARLHPDMVKNEGPCGAVAASLVADTYNAISAAERSGDEQAYKDALTAIVEDGTRLFMGIPSDAELSGDQPE